MPQLVEAGTVVLVIADPQPRVFVEATRNPGPLEAALADLALRGTAEDRLPSLRQEYLDVLADGSLEPGSEEAFDLGRQLAAAERTIVTQRLDPLPDRFYPSAGDDADNLGLDAFDALAGHGWTAFPYATAGQGPDVRRGFRIGKLRIAGTSLVWEGERKPQQVVSVSTASAGGTLVVSIADSAVPDAERIWLGVLAEDGLASSWRLEHSGNHWRGERVALGEVAIAAIYRDGGRRGWPGQWRR
ncbi:MAG: hypothetical protein VYE73_13830 [Acidobacteriota bacterium]|nr:hypothetical protein [Acidobacteriota bacterium]